MADPLAVGVPDRVADIVYERLREAIFSGLLTAGERLSVPALAGRLNVSRSPVREAVMRLVQDGLAVEERNKGAIVARWSAVELGPVYEVREVLEGLAASLAAARADDAAKKALVDAFARHESAVKARRTKAALDLDMEFHRAVVHAAANAELRRHHEQIQDRIRVAMLSTVLTAGQALALEDHRRILDAIVASDAGHAERAGRAHVRRLLQALNDSLTDDDRPRRSENGTA